MAEHKWSTNSGEGGEPEYRTARQMSLVPITHVRCIECGARTWFTQKQWQDLDENLKTEQAIGL